jgi:ABC-type nickel/cobalt efflux system permease component RcnA
MKYKLLLILFAFLLVSCSKTNDKKSDTHTHEDGTVHTTCCDDEHEKPEQESFEVEADSSATEKDAIHVHDEADGHDHDHDHNSTTHKH